MTDMPLALYPLGLYVVRPACTLCLLDSFVASPVLWQNALCICHAD